LNLGWTVSDDKGPFNGRQTLRAEKSRGGSWSFVGLEIEWNSLERAFAERGLSPALPGVPWRTSAPIYAGGRQIGYATSGCWSPLLKKSLALAHLTAPHFTPGTTVDLEMTVEHRRKRVSAVVRRLPFLDLARKRA
jgi:aminomethyltransferase